MQRPFAVIDFPGGSFVPVLVTTIETRGSRLTASMRCRCAPAVSQKRLSFQRGRHDHAHGPAVARRPVEGALGVRAQQLLALRVV
jgi:hypothetical protein